MPTELDILRLLLIAAMVLAPIVAQRFFVGTSRFYQGFHIVALAATTAGLVFEIPILTFAWLAFCVFGGVFYLRVNRPDVSVAGGATLVPFVFSAVAALWLVTGSNDYKLLGYGKEFSYYASLHGHVLGWIVVSCIAYLAREASKFRPFYLACVYVCLGSFFLVAFGIDGVPYIKKVGVVGITIAVPGTLLAFLFAQNTSVVASMFAVVSLIGLVFTMTLAWQNEFGITSVFLGSTSMVSLHGVINGLVVAPCMFLAVHFGITSD